MPARFPRVLTEPTGTAALRIDELDSYEDGTTGREQLVFGCRFQPRGPHRNVAVNVGFKLLDRYKASDWGFESGQDRTNAELLMTAIVGRMLEIAVRDKEDPETALAAQNGRNQHDGWDFARGLRERPAAEDGEIWLYVTSKIHWSWRYGLPGAVFDKADDLQLGLPTDAFDDKTGLPPGQIERVAAIGVGEYWRELDDAEGYVPTLRLVRDFPDSLPEVGA